MKSTKYCKFNDVNKSKEGVRVNSAKLLLEKVNSQLHGERVPIRPKEEGELDSYLNSLTKKSVEIRKSINFEDYGDISISSGANILPHKQSSSVVVRTGSKFLKKKVPNHDDKLACSNYESKGLPHQPAVVATGDLDGSDLHILAGLNVEQNDFSFASDKAMTAGKFTQQSVIFHQKLHNSYDIVKDPATAKYCKSQPNFNTGSVKSSVHDGKKMMTTQASWNDIKLKEDGLLHASAHLSTYDGVSLTNNRRSTVRPPATDQHRRSSLLTTPSSIYLTTEEQSIAEFVEGISISSEDVVRGLGDQDSVPKNLQSIIDESSSLLSQSDEMPIKATGQGKEGSRDMSYRKISTFHRRSHDSALSDVCDMSNDAMLAADSIRFDDPVHFSGKDDNILGPVLLVAADQQHRDYLPLPSMIEGLSVEKRQKQSRHGNKRQVVVEESDKLGSKPSCSLFHSLGVYLVDELMIGNKETETPDEPVVTTHSRLSPERQVSFVDDVDSKFSDPLNLDGKHKDNVLLELADTPPCDVDTEKEYSEDFSSGSLSNIKEPESDKSLNCCYLFGGRDLTQCSTNLSSDESTDSRSLQDRKIVVEQRSIEIQTGAPFGFNCQLISQTGLSVMGTSYGLDHVDSTPIAAAIIKPDDLESVTSYSPGIVAVHDMLKQHVELIKQFSRAHNQLYRALTETNQPDYLYTTLEDTKECICKHRRTKLRMKEALKLVDQEMV